MALRAEPSLGDGEAVEVPIYPSVSSAKDFGLDANLVPLVCAGLRWFALICAGLRQGTLILPLALCRVSAVQGFGLGPVRGML